MEQTHAEGHPAPVLDTPTNGVWAVAPHVEPLPAGAWRDTGRLAILSNGSRPMLEAACAAAGIGARLEAILSSDDVRDYKPDPRIYRLATERFGVAPNEVRFVSGNVGLRGGDSRRLQRRAYLARRGAARTAGSRAAAHDRRPARPPGRRGGMSITGGSFPS